MKPQLRQSVRYLRTADGVRLAWAQSGEGPVVVKACNWLGHLEYEWESPVWRHWLRFFSEHFRFIRYDERGCGMSEWNAENLCAEMWLQDLEAVIQASGATPPFTLFGISQGSAACILYALRYPERVRKMIIYGGYARGAWRRGLVTSEKEHRAITELISVGWGRDNPAFRQVFTSRFIPGGTEEQLRWFNELCLKSTNGELAGKLMAARGVVDITDVVQNVRVPTLILHADKDQIVPISEGRLLAAAIEGSEFVELDSANHVLLEHEPAWARFKQEVLRFLDVAAPAERAEDPAFAELSIREREILALLAEGLSNADIAERLAISGKTVRNHTSNLFDKLGVWTRAQAIVFARDRGFRAPSHLEKSSTDA
jgi:pimeloyl-ACP methyl ester carboxylesterase/DNA-binding CsgD family transcriptional regulator